ncbi:MAG TPA: hypothetical protein VLK89_02095 [Solirubrobacterales bacterium]|nr:hypothetical protein [Solirubrobacterales bacterium]
MSATVTIGPKERATLHWLMVRRLFILGQDPPELARSEGVSHDELAGEFGEDPRLMGDLGWEVEDDRKAVDLTMSSASLIKTIRRLRRDARRAPSEPPREHDPQGEAAGRWERFREAVGVCDEVLDLLDSPHRVDAEEANATERAARHERSDEVATATVVEHLGFEPTKQTNRLLHLRLDDLRNAGSLTRAARDGGDSWALTSEGREELQGRGSRRSAGGAAASRLAAGTSGGRRAARSLQRRDGDLAGRSDCPSRPAHPPRSAEWFAMSERLSPVAGRVGSATHCLYEWVEPDDDHPGVDERPGPSPGRRAISAWDQTTSESGGPS